jgi:hypothetical protein
MQVTAMAHSAQHGAPAPGHGRSAHHHAFRAQPLPKDPPSYKWRVLQSSQGDTLAASSPMSLGMPASQL